MSNIPTTPQRKGASWLDPAEALPPTADDGRPLSSSLSRKVQVHAEGRLGQRLRTNARYDHRACEWIAERDGQNVVLAEEGLDVTAWQPLPEPPVPTHVQDIQPFKGIYRDAVARVQRALAGRDERALQRLIQSARDAAAEHEEETLGKAAPLVEEAAKREHLSRSVQPSTGAQPSAPAVNQAGEALAAPTDN